MSQVERHQPVSKRDLLVEQTARTISKRGGDGDDDDDGRRSGTKRSADRQEQTLTTRDLIDAGASPGEVHEEASDKLSATLAQKSLSAADFDKAHYQSDELNNNSIEPQSKRALGGAQQAAVQQQQQQQQSTPLSLLTSLRMHTSHLRAQQQQQMSSRKQPGAKSDELRASQTRASPSGSPSYVESSLNPPETPISKPATLMPSYTSIYQQKVSATSSPSPEQLQAKLASAPPSTTSGHSQQQLVQSTIVQRTTASSSSTTIASPGRHQSGSRSPLIKKSPGEPIVRSLFASSLAKGGESKPATKRLPSLFDHGRHLAKVSDFDESTAERRRRLQRHFRGDNIIDYEDENDGHHLADEEEEEDDDDDDDDDEIDYQERGLDENSESSALSNRAKGAGHLLPRHPHHESSGKHSVNSSPESCIKSDKQPVAKHFGRGRSPARQQKLGTSHQVVGGKKLSQLSRAQSQSQTRISSHDMSRPPSFNTTTTNLKHQQSRHDLDMKAASCRKLDLLEQVAHLECSCNICTKNRKLAGFHDSLYPQLAGSTCKLSNFNLNKSLPQEKNYPKTRFAHMVLKSIILVLCTLLLLLLLVGTILLSVNLPHSMDKVVNASRSFNVTIAGRR